MYYAQKRLQTPLGQSYTLTLYARKQFEAFPDPRLWPMVLIFPGGGFAGISEREEEHMALPFLAAGYQAAVVRYNLLAQGPFYPTAISVGLSALQYLKTHGQEIHGDPQKIVTAGFSAGGHLVAVMNALGKDRAFLESNGFESDPMLPAAQILGYPVIDLNLGFPTETALISKISPDPRYRQAQKLVSPETPPTFIWHTVTDELVPVANTLVYLEALVAQQVKFESHIYSQGVHGLAFGDIADSRQNHPEDLQPRVQNWFDQVLTWLTSDVFSNSNPTVI